MSKDDKVKARTYSDDMIRFIGDELAKGSSWNHIAKEFNSKFSFKKAKTQAALQWAYQNYKNCVFTEDEMIGNIKSARRASNSNRKVKKENNVIIDHLNQQEDVVKAIEKVIKSGNVSAVKIPKPTKPSKNKTDLAVEMLISDIHIGIKTKSTNLDVLERRVEKFVEVTLEEIERLKKNYNVVKVHMILNGDLMQGNHLHGYDSAKSCEFSDARQVAEVIRVMYYKAIVPLAKTGIKLDILGMCGNHDRQGKDRSTVEPGEEYLTYTMYTSMQMMCTEAKLTNVSWEIPIKEFAVYEMFGHWFAVEHGHAPGLKPTEVSLEKQLLKRSNQAGKILKGIRIGHYHSPLISGLGRHIVNGSPVSDDHYGDLLGYVSYPSQMLNFYVESDRDTSYYHSFQVNLGDVV